MESTRNNPFGTIVLGPGGVRIETPAMQVIVLPWDEIVEVSVSAYRASSAVERCLSFDHVSGHVVEVWQRSNGWERAISALEDYMSLVVEDPDAVCRDISPDDEPVIIARPASMSDAHE